MSTGTLQDYGLIPVATVKIEDKRFAIHVTDTKTVELERCVYAFIIGDEIVRIGSSKKPLKCRLRRWENDVTKALNGKKSLTPAPEAKAWENKLSQHGTGKIFARQGSRITTPIGAFHAYLDEESILIGRHRPCLNRNSHR